MVYRYQFGLNIFIGSEEGVPKRLIHIATFVYDPGPPQILGQRHEFLIIPIDWPTYVSMHAWLKSIRRFIS